MSTPQTLVEMTRGGIVESVHRGWVVVARPDGSLVASIGDPERVTFARSAMKPFQAVALVESGAVDRFGFGDAELAVACASHNGEDRHRAVVKGMLDKLGLPVAALQAGDDEPHDETRGGLAGARAPATHPASHVLRKATRDRSAHRSTL